MKTILTLIATALVATALAVSPAAAETHALAGPSGQQSDERYIPFVTDFPESRPDATAAGVGAAAADGFDGLDAAVGAAVGLTLGALAAVSLRPARRRRHAPADAITGSGS